MTQEEKQLLFKDLSARLSYGVMVKVVPEGGGIGGVESYDIKLNTELLDELDFADAFKPYLRPMSSMTEEEEKEFVRFTSKSMHRFVCEATGSDHWFNVWEEEDWLNANHFDYRGLIPMGLALEAPVNMDKN